MTIWFKNATLSDCVVVMLIKEKQFRMITSLTNRRALKKACYVFVKG